MFIFHHLCHALRELLTMLRVAIYAFLVISAFTDHWASLKCQHALGAFLSWMLNISDCQEISRAYIERLSGFRRFDDTCCFVACQPNIASAMSMPPGRRTLSASFPHSFPAEKRLKRKIKILIIRTYFKASTALITRKHFEAVHILRHIIYETSMLHFAIV